MRRLLVLGLALAGLACSPLLSGGTGVTLANRSDSALLYLAMDAESATLVDPNPVWRVADHLDRLVERGEEVEIEAEGYRRGRGVTLFLYAVPEGDRATVMAPLADVVTLTDRQLRASGYRVVVREL